MKYTKLSENINVSAVCLGAMMFGTTTTQKDAYAVLDAFLDIGGNFIDTSNNYAHWAGTGDESETLLGQWLSERKCRDRVVIATKVGFDRKGQGAGLKKEQIEYWIEESLRKLKTDYVDLYYAHTDDMSTPMEETAEAFDRLVQKGKVRLLGGSNYDTWRFSEFNAMTREKGYTPYTVMQQNFSYLLPKGDVKPGWIFNEPVTRERLRYLEHKNIPLVAYSCMLGGAYEHPERLPNHYIGGARLEFIREMAKEKGVTASALAVAWMTNAARLAGYPEVIPLFASSKVDHFMDNCKGIDLVLTDDEMAALDQA